MHIGMPFGNGLCVLRTGYGHFRCCCKNPLSGKYQQEICWNFCLASTFYHQTTAQNVLHFESVKSSSDGLHVALHVCFERFEAFCCWTTRRQPLLACLLALQFHKFHFAFAKNCMHLALAFAYTNTRGRCLEVQFRWQPPVNNRMPNKTPSCVNNSEARRRDSSLKKKDEEKSLSGRRGRERKRLRLKCEQYECMHISVCIDWSGNNVLPVANAIYKRGVLVG